eukprot:4154686-Pyramimonas_sp.AAC.1
MPPSSHLAPRICRLPPSSCLLPPAVLPATSYPFPTPCVLPAAAAAHEWPSDGPLAQPFSLRAGASTSTCCTR